MNMKVYSDDEVRIPKTIECDGIHYDMAKRTLYGFGPIEQALENGELPYENTKCFGLIEKDGKKYRTYDGDILCTGTVYINRESNASPRAWFFNEEFVETENEWTIAKG